MSRLAAFAEPADREARARARLAVLPSGHPLAKKPKVGIRGLVLELVRLGQGVSLIPAMAVPKGRDKGREYRSMAGDWPSRTVALAWNRLRYQTQIFKRFVEFVSASQ